MIKIKVQFDKSKKTISSIEVKGHAGSAEVGKDLVCAAVSAVVTGGFNAIINPKNFSLQLEKGYALVKAIKTPSIEDNVVLSTIVTQLTTIYEANKEFVDLDQSL